MPPGSRDMHIHVAPALGFGQQMAGNAPFNVVPFTVAVTFTHPCDEMHLYVVVATRGLLAHLP